jgi:hypothetical protein
MIMVWEWRELSSRLSVPLQFIEVPCSDETTHQARLIQRRHVDGLPNPSWDSVLERRATFPPWMDRRLVRDTTAPRPENVACLTVT